MPVWFKLDVQLPNNPKIKRATKRAGFWAPMAYVALLAINKANAFKGVIPADYGAPSELADWWKMEGAPGLDADPVTLMKNGVLACRDENLVALARDSIELVGWGPEWDRNDSSAERQKRYREKKNKVSQQSETIESDVTLRNGVTDDGVTPARNVTEGVHRGEERRIEEKREPYGPFGKEPPPSPAPEKPKRQTKVQKLLAKHREEAGELWDRQEMLRAQVIPKSRPLVADDDRLGRICKLLGGTATREDCEAVLRAYASEAKRNPESAQWFNGETNWIKKNFDRCLGGLGAQAPSSGRAKPMARDEYSESGKQELK